MIPLDNNIAQLAWTHCWQIAAVAVIVGVANWLFFARRAHAAYLLWLLVLIKCFTPPLWSSPVGILSWRLPGVPAISTSSPGVTSPQVVPLVSPNPNRNTVVVASEPGASPAVESVDVAAEGTQTVAEQREASAEAAFTPGAILAIVWFAGAVYLAARMLQAVYVWRAAIRRRCVSMDPSLAALADTLQRRLGIRRKVHLSVVSQPIGPLTYGLFRSHVVLPQALVSGRSSDVLELVLAHELVHVRRGDSLVGVLQMVMQCVWWFHPCVWWANRRISLERERCCDEEVIAELGCAPGRYAHCLVDVLEQKRQPPTVAFVVGIRTFEVTKQRLEYVMRQTERGHKKTPWQYWLFFAMAMAVVAPGAGRTEEPTDGVQESQALSDKADDDTKQAGNQKPEQASSVTEDRKIAATKPEINVRNVELTKGDKAGEAVLKFNVDAAKGSRFFVQYMHRGVRGASMSNSVWETNSDGGAEVQVTFSYHRDFKGDRGASPLMSQEEMLNYELDVKGVDQPGRSTNVTPPLFNVAPADRAMRIIASAAERDAVTADGWRRILLVVPKSEADKDVAAATKRTELVVGLYTEETKKERSAVQRLTDHWARQDREIGSAQIKFRISRPGEGRLAPLSQEQVNKILDDAKLNEHAENFETVLAKLWEPTELKERLWSAGEFYSIGLKTRQHRDKDVRLFDGELDLNYDEANNQVSVYRGSESRVSRMTMSEFRMRRPATSLAPFDHELLSNNRIVLSVGPDKIVADYTTGFVYQTSSRSGDGVSERFQFAPIRYPGGIVFPKLKIEVRYQSDELQHVELIYIDNAEFNEGMMADTFKLAVKAGTNVFKFERDPIARPRSFRVLEDANDLADLIRSREGW